MIHGHSSDVFLTKGVADVSFNDSEKVTSHDDARPCLAIV